MKNFNDLGISEVLLRAVSEAGYTQATPIQGKVIPAMIAGSDIVGIAQTGTGKTASFVLPILHHVHEQARRPQPKTCGALILAPTRELAAQIHDNVRLYAKFMNVSSALVVGGVKPHKQIKALARGLDILVATPGRLEDHQSTGAVRLDATTTVVLDEADQMLDMGFIPAIRRILAALPKRRQTILMSATMPKQIRALSNDFLYKPQEIAVTPASKPIEKIEQRLMSSAGQNKKQMLANILKNEPIERAIVFSRTKHGANKIVQYLEKNGLSSAAIHGNKSQGQREKALAAFKNGAINTLIATDIAARGIDISDVSHVINIDLPNVPEVYVHRIGRTARAGKSGVAISFCSEAEIDLLKDIEKLVGRIPGERPDGSAAPVAETAGKQTKSSLSENQRRNQRRRKRSKQNNASNGGQRDGQHNGQPKAGRYHGGGRTNAAANNNSGNSGGNNRQSGARRSA